MNKPRAFNLNDALAAWRRPLEQHRAFLPGDVDELEEHLRDHIDRLQADGLDAQTAFREATARMGAIVDLEPEYEKVRWTKHRYRRSLWLELFAEQTMLKNYLTIALRTLRRHKGYTFINISGLALGLACCLLIGLYVWHERSYDQHHENADRIYRLLYTYGEGADAPKPPRAAFAAWGSAAPGPALAEDFPEVEHVVRFSGGHTMLLQRDNTPYQEEDYYFADSTVFQVFDFALLKGNPATALARPNTIVLTETAARKYFGDDDPMGETLRMDNDTELVVTGVMADLPSNTHFRIDMLLSIITFEQTAPDYMFQSWGYIDFFTYVLLREGQDAETVKAKLPAFITQRIGDQLDDETYFLDLEPLADAYLSPDRGILQVGPKGNPANLSLFAMAGLFILLIAGINFTNLSTARSMARAKEVGVRKVIGSARRMLVQQFLMESVVLALLAMVLALGLAALSIPLLGSLSGGVFTFALLLQPTAWALLFAMALVVGLLAGSYPALVLSAFNPVVVLKGAFTRSKQGVWLRKGLVGAQFVISALLLIGTLGVFYQLDFLRSQSLGFADEQQLVLDHGHDRTVVEQLDAALRTFGAHPAVQQAMATRSYPGSYRPNAGTSVEGEDGRLDEQAYHIFEVGAGFVPHLGLELVAGRAFDPLAFPTDSTQALMINEAAARLHGYANPADAVGKLFAQWGREGEVIGVLKDFNHESLHRAITPLSLRFAPFSTRFLVLQVDTQDLPQTLAQLETQWTELFPHLPFLYSFMDASFDAQYRAEERFGRLFSLFSGLALFVACLGLFGIATFTTQQRTKEIGVRKVLGASVPQLVGLLSKDIVRLLLMALVVAFSLAYFGLSRWLDQFAYRMAFPFVLFAIAGVSILAVALLTVSYQTLRAATADPVKSLRYE